MMPDPETVRFNLERARGAIAAACQRAGRSPDEVELLAATKYVTLEGLEALATAGVTLLGENRAQDLLQKQERYGDRFTWDFIGHLQSNKVRQVLPRVRLIHSVASLSVVREIARRTPDETKVLLEVNIGEEASKYGIIPGEVDRFLEEAASYPQVNFNGLMTMPPLAADSESARPFFVALKRLASRLSENWQGRYRFHHLSMGTSNDFVVAVEEGATIVRLGGTLLE